MSRDHLFLYSVYKKNEALIKNYPSIFYKNMILIFKNIWIKESEPYKYISDERIIKTMEDLKPLFKEVHRNFDCKRADFQ
jgi:hypothetical protein